MKKADIELNKDYLADVDYNRPGRVTVLELGVSRRPPYGSERKDGVRVRVAETVTGLRGAVQAGDEITLTTREIKRPWTEGDDERAAERRREQARADRIRDELVGRGYGVRSGALFDADAAVNVKSVQLTLDAAERLLGIEAES